MSLFVFSTGDNTLDNIMPRFARLFVTGKDVDGTSLWVSEADGEAGTGGDMWMYVGVCGDCLWCNLEDRCNYAKAGLSGTCGDHW